MKKRFSIIKKLVALSVVFAMFFSVFSPSISYAIGDSISGSVIGGAVGGAIGGPTGLGIGLGAGAFLGSSGIANMIGSGGGVGGSTLTDLFSGAGGGKPISSAGRTSSTDLLDVASSAGKACMAQMGANFLTNLLGSKIQESIIGVANAMNVEVPVREGGQLLSKEIMADGLAYCLLNGFIESILQSTIKWAKTGFDGSPVFIEDANRYFKQKEDEIWGEFLNGLSFGVLCQPWSIEIKLALLLEYKSDKEELCTLSEIEENLRRFRNNDFRNGGWKGWFKLTQSQNNNFYGRYDKEREIIQGKVNAQQNKLLLELNWANGFLSDVEVDENTRRRTVTTPGRLMANNIESTFNIPAGRLTVADELDELLSVVLNYFLTTGFNEVFGNDKDKNFDSAVRNWEAERETIVENWEAEQQALRDQYEATSDERPPLTACVLTGSGSSSNRGSDSSWVAYTGKLIGQYSSGYIFNPDILDIVIKNYSVAREVIPDLPSRAPTGGSWTTEVHNGMIQRLPSGGTGCVPDQHSYVISLNNGVTFSFKINNYGDFWNDGKWSYGSKSGGFDVNQNIRKGLK
ncbi:MAG TPA: hypothetical protein PKA60_01095 [Candidatus Paceibacterota bacterium]|nr:hypothetical protein [Candidatus Paceibacterota bacterium]